MLALLAGVTAFSSCADQLDIEQKGTKTTDSFYKNDADCEKALAYAYEGFMVNTVGRTTAQEDRASIHRQRSWPTTRATMFSMPAATMETTNSAVPSISSGMRVTPRPSTSITEAYTSQSIPTISFSTISRILRRLTRSRLWLKPASCAPTTISSLPAIGASRLSSTTCLTPATSLPTAT